MNFYPMSAARLTKVFVAAALALFALIAAFNNITDFDTNFAFIRHVLSMDTTAPGNPLIYRAVNSGALQYAAFIGIIVVELAAGLCFLSGAMALWGARQASAYEFVRSRRWIYIGAALALLLWYVGFLVIAGEWFLMRQSKSWNTVESAFRIHVAMFLGLIYINQTEPELH